MGDNDQKQGGTFVMEERAGAPVTFDSFLLGLAGTALIHLGVAPDPESGKLTPDMTLARHSLDVLGVLREKTRGNLSAEEERLFDSLLTEMRLRFVEASKR